MSARVIWRILRVQAMAEVQYRANFVLRLVHSVLSLGTGLIALWLVFTEVDRLNGWTRPQLLVVMGVFTMIGGLVRMVVVPNVTQFLADLQEGEFDQVLAKPVDAQLVASIRVVEIWQGVDVVVGAGVVVTALVWQGGGVEPVALLGFLLALGLGAVLVYSFLMSLAITAFWFVRLDNVVDLFDGVNQAGRWPLAIYPGWLRAGLTFVVPVGLAVTMPAEALTSRLHPAALAGEALLAAVLCGGTRLLWRLGLRHYAGASS